MTNKEIEIDDFFNGYAAKFNWALWEGQFSTDEFTHSFADDFIGASPVGIRAGKNDATFKEAISKHLLFYKNLGIHSITIISKNITMLDDFHAMVKIRWQSLFVTKDGRAGEIEFDVIYFVQLRSESVKIFAYVTGDEQKALKNAGLLESTPFQVSHM